MSAHSFAQSVGRHLLGSTIGNATKDYILARRNLYVRENLSKVVNGDVVAGLPVLMHWDDISVLKLAGYASNLS